MATTHLQQQILTALAATLVAAGTAAGSRVYVDHPDDLTPAQLPALVLQPGDEAVQTQGMAGIRALQDRAFLLDITAVCGGSGAAAAARDLGRAVEVALYATDTTATAGGLCRPVELQGSSPSVNGTTSQVVAELRQTWRITYATQSGVPHATA